MKRKKPTPHQRIKRAALAQKGLRLSAYEVAQLYYMDDAIATAAGNDDFRDDEAAIEAKRPPCGKAGE